MLLQFNKSKGKNGDTFILRGLGEKFFQSKQEKFGEQVFIVFSIDDKIKNEDVIGQIACKIKRLLILNR
jgi:hypothetical protein